MIGDLPENKKIVLFDGVCNLCNQTVNYIIAHDKKDIFRFVSLDSELGRSILNYLRLDPQKADSVILYEPGIAYFTQSEAVFEISKDLSGFAPLLGCLAIFPMLFRNHFYNYIARNRYKWFGKNDRCLLPNNSMSKKFL